MNNEAKPMQIPIYHSWESGNAKNCRYPNVGAGSTPEELKSLFCYDHTFIRFKNSYRSIENFEEAAVAAADIDNDHSDDPGKWIYVQDIPRLFPEVPCIVYTSRNHMKQKGKYSPRPRFHVVFLVDPITDPKTYTELMQRIQMAYPFFDDNALDAGRFFFGNPDTEVYIFPGSTTIDQFLDAQAAVIGWIPAMMPKILPAPEFRKSSEDVKRMIPEELSRYLWEGLDLQRYTVVRIVPQDKDNAVVIMYSNDPNDPHWCLQYKGNGHYFASAKELMDYYCSRGFKKLHLPYL